MKLYATAGFIKTVPSVYTYLSIPEYTGNLGNRFQEANGNFYADHLYILNGW